MATRLQAASSRPPLRTSQLPSVWGPKGSLKRLSSRPLPASKMLRLVKGTGNDVPLKKA